MSALFASPKGTLLSLFGLESDNNVPLAGRVRGMQGRSR